MSFTAANTRSKYMTDSRRERLQKIQKREQMKGLLANKFKLKYGNRTQSMVSIDAAVSLRNDSLTLGNVKTLDSRIGKEILKGPKKADNNLDKLGDRPETTRILRGQSIPEKNTKGGITSGIQSVRNTSMARTANLSKQVETEEKPATRFIKAEQIGTGSLPRMHQQGEWTALLNFNQILHHEEQKQSLRREKERKRLIKQELDFQVLDKRRRQQLEQHNSDIYDKLQEFHREVLDQNERERVAELRENALAE